MPAQTKCLNIVIQCGVITEKGFEASALLQNSLCVPGTLCRGLIREVQVCVLNYLGEVFFVLILVDIHSCFASVASAWRGTWKQCLST